MKNSYLIPWEEARKEWFTKEELEEQDRKIRERLALREIEELRNEYNLTQHQLSIKSGVPRSTISKIENGKRNVCFDKLVQIANALGKDIEIKFVDKKK
jgi:DNA-binding XRE family transcriptional regulator